MNHNLEWLQRGGFTAKEYDRFRQQEAHVAKPLTEIADSAYTCPKCGSRKIKMAFVQLRSGDEGTNVFLACTECHHDWNI
jgi:DNA-directed RNA polymerase subunit M/transcription elongation factor TFIIS